MRSRPFSSAGIHFVLGLRDLFPQRCEPPHSDLLVLARYTVNSLYAAYFGDEVASGQYSRREQIMRQLLRSAIVVLLGAALLSGCTGGSGASARTDQPTPTPTATATLTPTPEASLTTINVYFGTLTGNPLALRASNGTGPWRRSRRGF